MYKFFKKGNIYFLIISAIIYLTTVYTVPIIFYKVSSGSSGVDIMVVTSIISSIILIYLSSKNKNSIENRGIRVTIFMSILIGIIGFLLVILLQGVINMLLQYFAQYFSIETTSENTSNITSLIKIKPIFIFYGVILAPIMEEIFFRKALFGYLYDLFEGVEEEIRFLIPGMITGIVFAIPHDGFSAIMIVYILISLVFSFMYVKTKRIVTPIVAHMLMNGLVLFVQLFSF